MAYLVMFINLVHRLNGYCFAPTSGLESRWHVPDFSEELTPYTIGRTTCHWFSSKNNCIGAQIICASADDY